MPKRVDTKRFDCEEIQGKDSYVVVSFQTVAEMREVREKRAAAKADKKLEFDAFEVGIEVLRTHVLSWNWVDDDGAPLPQMQKDPTVVDQLLDTEVAFLSKCILGSEEEAKN